MTSNNMEHYSAQIFSIGNGIIDYVLAISWTRVVFRLKIFSFIISSLAFVAIVWTLKRHRDILLSTAKKSREAALLANAPDRDEKRFIAEEWTRIMGLWASPSSEEKRLALIEADAVLDNVLRDYGVEGESIAERLGKPECPRLTNIADIVFAHAFRNELVHETGATFDPIDASRAFAAYETALKELKVI